MTKKLFPVSLRDASRKTLNLGHRKGAEACAVDPQLSFVKNLVFLKSHSLSLDGLSLNKALKVKQHLFVYVADVLSI
jgi:hypothetical protein